MSYETRYRTHTCGEPRGGDVGRRVRLAGWVHRRRDQGGIVFLDLRDRYGICQVRISKETQPEAHAAAAEVRPEFVLQVEGEVQPRPAGARNPNLATGAVEVAAARVEILADSPTPPFEIASSEQVSSEIRFRYRPLDLRRPEVQRHLLRRHRIHRLVREFFSERGFVEIETPILAKATPEGARDFLVPSRLHHGNFYALPQSPQIYKQLLMCAGFDRYFQIARCFRDEDQRAHRQWEFTQLDLEMSFVEQEDVLRPVEEMLALLLRETAVHPCELELPLPRIPYTEAMARYGTDKPDLRYGLEIEDVSGAAAETEFEVFRGAAAAGGAVRALRVPGGAELSRKEIDALESVARRHGAKGLAWVKAGPRGLSGPAARFLSGGALPSPLGAEPGDLVLFCADASTEVVAWSLGAVRVAVAEARGLVPEGRHAACFVVDFPLFVRDEERGSWQPAHHPFTAPRNEDLPLLETDPHRVRAQAYDPVLDGVELGSGSVRIHRRDVQEAVFRALGMSSREAAQRFRFLLDTLRYGAPPHGGIALGLDRLTMLLCGVDSIREVIAFPKTTGGIDLMSDSPSPVEPAHLEELGIALRGEPWPPVRNGGAPG
ncbi:MAG: aspartate--tRNA ligase [Planctomycetota bacterium]